MVDQVKELAGKVAIVTGSSRNIGRATAEELARAGAAVVINAVQAKDLCEEVAEGIRAAGGKAIPVMADVRDPDAVRAMAETAVKEFGGIDILVANAANRSNTPFESLTWEVWKQTIDISIHGTDSVSMKREASAPRDAAATMVLSSNTVLSAVLH